MDKEWNPTFGMNRKVLSMWWQRTTLTAAAMFAMKRGDMKSFHPFEDQNSVWPSRCFGNVRISKPIIIYIIILGPPVPETCCEFSQALTVQRQLGKRCPLCCLYTDVLYMDATERWCQNACGTYVALDLLLLERGSAISQLPLVTQIWLCPMPSTKTHIEYTVNKSVQMKVLT